MNKIRKYIIITTSIICFLFVAGSLAYGAGVVSVFFENNKETLTVQEKNKLDKITPSVVEKIKEEGTDSTQIQQNLYEFASFIQTYQPTDEQLSYLNNLILNGYDTDKLIEIYRFWFDTDDDISMIKSIYDYAQTNGIGGSFWVEECYNKITDNRSGLLSDEDIQQYKQRGLELDDIEMANRLSRLGKKNIQTILEERIAAENWIDVVEPLYASSNSKKETAKKLKKIEAKDVNKTPNEIMDALFLTEKANLDLNSLLTDESVDVMEKKQEYQKIQTRNVTEKVSELVSTQ